MVVEKTLQKFGTEYHKGVAIQVVKKIVGNGPNTYVKATWTLQKKKYEAKGDTKAEVVARAKQIINKILG